MWFNQSSIFVRVLLIHIKNLTDEIMYSYIRSDEFSHYSELGTNPFASGSQNGSHQVPLRKIGVCLKYYFIEQNKHKSGLTMHVQV